jgi:hypothetical protein
VTKTPLLIPLLLTTSVVTGNVTIAQYREAKSHGGQTWQTVQTYVSGVGTGLLTANAMLEIEHKPLLYCQPLKLTLDANNYIEVLEKEIAETRPPDTMDINIVLGAGLKSTFPCPQQH